LATATACNIYKNEPGGHRWQRIPPTEKKGRVHTSTVTVACIYKDDTEIDVDLSDVVIRTTKDSGPGGQHRNKTESCVVMTDKKTGLTVKSAKKSQHQNREIAKTTLVERIRSQQLSEQHQA
jgi:peptide chain release factor 1